MDNDDRQVGRVLSRREVLALLGASGVALLVGCTTESPSPTPTASPSATSGAAATPTTAATATTAATVTTAPPSAATATTASNAAPPATQAASSSGTASSCVVRPEETEGPYFVDEKINRSDIRSDPSDGTVKEGTPLALTFLVSQISSSACTPLAGAQVDVWHCDALGVYSDSRDPGFNTTGKKFLRGYQATDANGRAAFTTIYPGWYQGRTVHIHFKIRTNTGSSSAHEFTSQLYFDDTLTDKVHSQQPYAAKGQRTLRNAGDGIYRTGGDQLLLTVTDNDQGGYAATFDIGLQF